MRTDFAATDDGQDLKSDLAELRAALASHVPVDKVEQILARYVHHRKEIRIFAFGRHRSDLPSAKLRVPPRIPADIPEEFNLYLRGAAAYHLKTSKAHATGGPDCSSSRPIGGSSAPSGPPT